MGGLLDFMKGANDAAASTLYGPVDLLSLALRKAGMPMPDDQNVPGSKAWMQSKGLLHEAPVNRASAAGQTLGLLSPIVAQAKAPQISAGLLRMIDNANAPGAMNAATRNQAGAIVYHGSPHKFDKFDSTKIGSGEGAQAYGHGLYVAESPTVAKSYQETLAGRVGIGAARASDSAYVHAARSMHDAGYNEDQMLSALKRAYKSADEKDLRLAMHEGNPGSLYKIDLPDEHIAKMLDWDKPLSQQAPEVRAAIDNIKLNLTGPFSRDMTGDQLLMHIQSTLKGVGRGSEKAESVLKQQGIPGIRYLDGGSRTAGAGSSNFVVFPGNEGLLSILERNGVPINGK